MAVWRRQGEDDAIAWFKRVSVTNNEFYLACLSGGGRGAGWDSEAEGVVGKQ